MNTENQRGMVITHAVVNEITGFSNGVIDQAVTRGLFTPSHSPGKGSPRHYTFEEAMHLVAISRLMATGLRIGQALKIAPRCYAEPDQTDPCITPIQINWMKLDTWLSLKLIEIDMRDGKSADKARAGQFARLLAQQSPEIRAV